MVKYTTFDGSLSFYLALVIKTDDSTSPEAEKGVTGKCLMKNYQVEHIR